MASVHPKTRPRDPITAASSASPSTRRYHLGLKLVALAARASTAHGFAGAALPILRELAASTQEAALMSVLESQHQLYVHCVQGPRQVNVIGESGRLGPLPSTSMGKVLIASPRGRPARTC